jgi:hypothetical protein
MEVEINKRNYINMELEHYTFEQIVIEENENGNQTYQNLWNTGKAVL